MRVRLPPPAPQLRKLLAFPPRSPRFGEQIDVSFLAAPNLGGTSLVFHEPQRHREPQGEPVICPRLTLRRGVLRLQTSDLWLKRP